VPTFADVRGQERALGVLRAALANRRLHHALLFTGPSGVGKRMTALAAALNCEREIAPGEACGTCATCTRIADGIHPDVITLAREGAAQIIPIETVRTQVIAAVGLPPHEARERVFLIDEANSLQPAAANSLLKTLEEPPARTRFVIMTVAPDQLLPTIRSRCQRVSFAPLGAEARKAMAGGESDPVVSTAEALIAAVERGVHAGAAIGVIQAAAGEQKLDVAGVIELAAIELHARARRLVDDGDVVGARLAADRASILVASHMAVNVHHGHGGVSLEALAHRLQRGGL
jgi:DNA polymerase-3 subunit delta'